MTAILASLADPLVPGVVALAGLAAWMSVAVGNNIVDRGTNIHLLGVMFKMELLRDEPVLGRGLAGRARTSSRFARAALTGVIIAQVIIAALLWLAAGALICAWTGQVARPVAVGLANLAVASFLGLWVLFLTGGLWFGYWMKMPQVQQVHLSLLTIALLMLVLIAEMR
jgi:predicted small integral membrane protein